MSSQTGIGTLEVVTAADRSLIQNTQLAESGVLTAISTILLSGASTKGGLWVEAGIMSGGIGDAFKIAVLVQGYLSVGQSPRFFGQIPLDPADNIYLEARASEVSIVRAQFLTLRETG